MRLPAIADTPAKVRELLRLDRQLLELYAARGVSERPMPPARAALGL
jgi:hypothetical protein